MTLSFSSPDKNRPWLTEFSFRDFEVSWAGAGPECGDLCFASEDGRYIIRSNAGITFPPRLGNEFGEVINGMAFHSTYVAVSSRNVVTFWDVRGFLGSDSSDIKSEIHVGAHDVVATAAGQFMAPLGQGGLLVAEATDKVVKTVTIKAAPDDLYYYRVASSGDTMACALRANGMLAVTVDGIPKVSKLLKLFTFEASEREADAAGADVVDVCAISSADGGRAYIAAGVDGTLVFFRDILNDNAPVIFAYGIEGAVYRVLSTREHVFLLTSAGLYSIGGLARRFLQGQPIEKMRAPLRLARLDAVDANLVNEKWLLVVMPNNKVIQIEIAGMFAQEAEPKDAIKWDDISADVRTPSGLIRTHTHSTQMVASVG